MRICRRTGEPAAGIIIKAKRIMKIGDKVRFLSETGGGTIVGFQNGNIALVEDNDGFQIPTQLQDLVVVNDDKQARTAMGGTMTQQHDDDKPSSKADAGHSIVKPTITPRPASHVSVYEREDSDMTNLLFGFVPKDEKNISKTSFYLYAINDCNYFISFTYSLPFGDEWKLLSHGELEPNTKQLIAEVSIDDIEDYSSGAVQMNAYKIDKIFKLQPTMDVKLRIDPVKFFKAHTFKENDFFDEDALIIPVVENSVPVKLLSINADELQKKMIEKQRVDITAPARHSQAKRNSQKGDEPLVIDLHISELLDSTAGMSHTDILKYQLEVFNNTLEEYKQKKGMKIIFIHGKGEGVLRNAIIKELRYRYKSYSYQDASFQEYGYGATQVTIH